MMIDGNERLEMTLFDAFRSIVLFFYSGTGQKDFGKNFSYTYQNSCITCESKSHDMLRLISQDANGGDGSESALSKGWEALLYIAECWGWKAAMQLTPSEGTVSLEIKGPGEEDFETFQEAVISVFYVQNPLCSTLLYEGDRAVVCRRSDVRLPDDILMGEDFWPEGVLFAGTRMLGIPVPYVFYIQDYPWPEDEGETPDPLHILRQVISSLDAGIAEDVLLSLRSNWKADSFGDNADILYPLIFSLVDKISASDAAKDHFRANNPYLLCAGYINSQNADRKKRREIAEEWLSRQQVYELGHECFFLLGVPTLEDVCARNGGYAGTDYENATNIVDDVHEV